MNRFRRHYEFYDNGRDIINSHVCYLRQVHELARGMFGKNTRYIDVLDEGVLVARLQ